MLKKQIRRLCKENYDFSATKHSKLDIIFNDALKISLYVSFCSRIQKMYYINHIHIKEDNTPNHKHYSV